MSNLTLHGPGFWNILQFLRGLSKLHQTWHTYSASLDKQTGSNKFLLVSEICPKKPQSAFNSIVLELISTFCLKFFTAK